MPFSFRSNCNTCKAIKQDKTLLQRIYNSHEYTKGGEYLTVISADTGIGYQSLFKHVKRHQSLSEEDLTQRQLSSINKLSKDRLVKQVILTADARQSLIQELYSVLESDDFKNLSPDKKVSLLLKALKDSDDVSAKSKDQNIDIVKMMQGARSSDMNPDYIDLD